MRSAFLARTEAAKNGRVISRGCKAARRSVSTGLGASAGMPIFLQRVKVPPRLKADPANTLHEQEADRVSAATQSNDGPMSARPRLRATNSSGFLEGLSLASSLVRESLDSTQENGSPLS